MFSRRKKQPEIISLTVTETREEAEQIQNMLQQDGIRSVLRDRSAEPELELTGYNHVNGMTGVEILINPEDAELAVGILRVAGVFEETEELTDEELEALALSMPEIIE